MIAEPLGRVLEATGYLSGGMPAAPSVMLAPSGETLGTSERALDHASVFARLPSFKPDAWWRSSDKPTPWGGSSGELTVYFKFVEDPTRHPVVEWQKEVWNRGFSPLLWIVSPDRVELYNGFGCPGHPDDTAENRLETFRLIDEQLAKLDALAGRLAMETGQFWRQESRVTRGTSVDRRLLRDIGGLERNLIQAGLPRDGAQGLIGRSIFTRYLFDRGIVSEHHLDAPDECRYPVVREVESVPRHSRDRDLPDLLRDRATAERLFDWLRETFNGDMFSSSSESVPAAEHLEAMARFLEGEDQDSHQMSLFPYRFDVIPVELISAIYEQFVHSSDEISTNGSRAGTARKQGVYYTPLAAVSLVLDEIFTGLTGDETVLDLTCGSGVFLVEALRRLVSLKSGGSSPSREMIRDALYRQVYGVDISPAAVRVAAFSLYLTALELDPEPHPPQALRFEPLEGRTLLIGDARDIRGTFDRQTALAAEGGPRKFDVIVGNPPWSFAGRAGTASRRATGSSMPLQPRGQSLDFVFQAMKFAHDRTRFGMILSAAPFFSRSSTGLEAARRVIETLAPVTLVNLSELSRWLFPKADMPAVVFLARCHEQRAGWMMLVHAPWSSTGEASHTIEVAPGNVETLPIASWKRNQGLFKAAFLGGRHDLLLLDDLWDKHKPLDARLEALGTRLNAGLISGNRSRDAAFLRGLPFVRGQAVGHFSLPDRLLRFDQDNAERPRRRDIYRAPLLLVKKEFMKDDPRPVVAVSKHDVVFTDTYFGVPFPKERSRIAYLVAGILGSALASWYFLMTASGFGLWMPRLKCADIAAMPIPELGESAESDAGIHICELVRDFHDCHDGLHDEDWKALDESVFDLYELDEDDRIVVRDGLLRASWQWKSDRLESVEAADIKDLEHYTRAFLSSMDAWFSAANRRRMRAEIFQLKHSDPLRVIRFRLEEIPAPSVLKIVRPDAPLSAVLARIGERAQIRMTSDLVGLRELRVHAGDEVSIIKPAARRHWLAVRGLEDATAVVKDSFECERAV